MDIAAATQDIVDRLTADGIRAVIDARDANPPCVQVRPPVISWRFGKGADAEWTALLMVGDVGTAQALKQLSELVELVQQALGFAAVNGRPDEAILPDGSTVPVYLLTWNQRIPA
jgi:hypothetical protein